MSIVIPPPPPINYDPAAGGCTAKGCRSQDTVTMDGRHGRRCAEHPPWLDLAAAGQLIESFECLRSWLACGGETA